jgi:hypothetical protein
MTANNIDVVHNNSLVLISSSNIYHNSNMNKNNWEEKQTSKVKNYGIVVMKK